MSFKTFFEEDGSKSESTISNDIEAFTDYWIPKLNDVADFYRRAKKRLFLTVVRFLMDLQEKFPNLDWKKWYQENKERLHEELRKPLLWKRAVIYLKRRKELLDYRKRLKYLEIQRDRLFPQDTNEEGRFDIEPPLQNLCGSCNSTFDENKFTQPNGGGDPQLPTNTLDGFIFKSKEEFDRHLEKEVDNEIREIEDEKSSVVELILLSRAPIELKNQLFEKVKKGEMTADEVKETLKAWKESKGRVIYCEKCGEALKWDEKGVTWDFYPFHKECHRYVMYAYQYAVERGWRDEYAEEAEKGE